MMKKQLGLLLLLSLTACATVDYHPYEGRADSVWEGQGGTKLVVDGIELWDKGAPPHKYKVIGYATGTLSSGYGADGIIHGAIAGKVKAMGGSAAILVLESYGETLGIVENAPYMRSISHIRELKYEVVQYLN
jgi:hypothetical protein